MYYDDSMGFRTCSVVIPYEYSNNLVVELKMRLSAFQTEAWHCVYLHTSSSLVSV